MRESCMYGSVRGARGNSRPYRNRREFITLLGGATAWPLAAQAQQSAMPVIGFVASVPARDSKQIVAAFHRGLNEAAFIEGRNVAIVYRWADNRHDHFQCWLQTWLNERSP
jgi:hypothetical protein